jgi:hypothetical protein
MEGLATYIFGIDLADGPEAFHVGDYSDEEAEQLLEIVRVKYEQPEPWKVNLSECDSVDAVGTEAEQKIAMRRLKHLEANPVELANAMASNPVDPIAKAMYGGDVRSLYPRWLWANEVGARIVSKRRRDGSRAEHLQQTPAELETHVSATESQVPQAAKPGQSEENGGETLSSVAPAALTTPDPPVLPVPVQYLTSWREILVALGMKDNKEDQEKVKKLNKTYNGPIATPKQGAQPKVDKAKLIKWWNGLDQKFQDSQQRQRDTKATAAAQHPYGQAGVVAPDMGGGVKKRRRDSTG